MSKNHYFSTDKPIKEPNDDLLGYAPLAKHIASSLCKMIPSQGFVVSIYGPWGSGKSSLLNFVEFYLKQQPDNLKPLIVHFNPWWFSDQESLTKNFFKQLISVFNNRKTKRKKIKKRIIDFAEQIVDAEYPGQSTARLLSMKGGVKLKDITSLKNEITEDLKEQEQRILVIIDDIDRLTIDEINQLFRLINTIGDFPNITYLLAFDKEIVVNALNDFQGLPGEKFLEKIVQVSLVIPQPSKISLRSIFFKKLDQIVVDSSKELFNNKEWYNIYYSGIDHFITNPRDIIRLTNVLHLTYPLVSGEVNLVDFIAIETIRIFNQKLYDFIRNNPMKFIGENKETHRMSNNDEFKQFHNSWIIEIPKEKREAYKQLMFRIFPRLEVIERNNHYRSDWLAKWKKELKICSPDIFPIYFRLTIPETSIGNSEMEKTIIQAKNREEFSDLILKLVKIKQIDGSTRVKPFLEQFEDHIEDLPQELTENILNVLFEIGDKLVVPEDEGDGFFSYGNDMRIIRIVSGLLSEYNEEKRFYLLKENITENKDSILVTNLLLIIISQQHGKSGSTTKRPEQERIVNEEHLYELEKEHLNNIRERSSNMTLLTSLNLIEVLYWWKRHSEESDKDEIKNWTSKVIIEDERLITLLESFKQKHQSQSGRDLVIKIEYRLNNEGLNTFFDTFQLKERIDSVLEKGNLSSNSKKLLLSTLKEIEK